MRPRYSIIENVKNLVSKRFKNEFNTILENIKKLGYTNYWKVLNSKDYGIPQRRERVFIVSIRNDIDKGKFEFPPPIPLNLKLKDLLEKNVDQKFYLTEKTIGKLINNDIDIAEENNRSSIQEEPYILIRENNKKGYAKAMEGDSINYTFPNCMTKRGRVGKGISQTILTASNMATLEKTKIPVCLNNQMHNSVELINIDKKNNVSPIAIFISKDNKYIMKIRKLTPLECWRLMGFSDIDFYKIKSINISDSQAYRQAGNSIVVKVLEAIFRNLLKNEE